MPRMSAIYLCLAVVALALVGCAPPLYHQTVYWGTFPEQPPDYSPDYTSLSERYTVRPYQASVTVTVPASVIRQTWHSPL